MSVLEAMSVARPVIATRVGGLPEVVEPGRTGFLISPDRPSELAHALANLARDPALPRNWGWPDGAPKAAFSIEAMTRGYAELLADLDRARRTGARRPGTGQVA